MLLVVSPNLAIDRILEVDDFQLGKVRRSRSVITQPGGKGSNVARVFRQMGGEVVLAGFVGRANGERISEPLRSLGITVDTVAAFGESRTCTVICDSKWDHPTVINEESPQLERGAEARLLTLVRRWIPRVNAVLVTGSLPTGLSPDFYARVLEAARAKKKVAAIDATGDALRAGLSARPHFMKPNTEEFLQLVRPARDSVLMLPDHTALTFGKAGAALIHNGRCIFAAPPRVFNVNPIGAGDAFAAAYLLQMLNRQPAAECLRLAMAAAACDAATLRTGFLDTSLLQSLAQEVELGFF